jgi:hypothetical protein
MRSYRLSVGMQNAVLFYLVFEMVDFINVQFQDERDCIDGMNEFVDRRSNLA